MREKNLYNRGVYTAGVATLQMLAIKINPKTRVATRERHQMAKKTGERVPAEGAYSHLGRDELYIVNLRNRKTNTVVQCGSACPSLYTKKTAKPSRNTNQQ